VVYPDSGTVQVYRPDGTARFYSGDAIIEDPELLPGFSLSLQEIFSV
jgi:Uma2 family endonuclease